MAEMKDDLDLGDFDDLDLGDDDLDMDLDLGDESDDLDMDLDLGDESDDLGDDLTMDVDPGTDDSAGDDMDLGGLDDLPSDEDLSLDEALGDDGDSGEGMDPDGEVDLDADSLSEDLDTDSEMDVGDSLIDPKDMSLDGEDFDLDDADEEGGDETFDMDADDGLDMESELVEDPGIDDEGSEDTAEESVDLSSLEDELGLDESEQVVAPEIEEIPDVESEDDLENELAGIGVDDDQGDVVLDESMEVQELDPEEDEMDDDVVDLDALIDATDDDDELEEDILAIDESEISSSAGEMEVESPDQFDEFDIVDDLIESEPISDDAIELESIPGVSPGQFKKPEPISNGRFEAKAQSQEPILGKDLLFNLPHQLTVQVGKASLKGADISSLTYGSVIELDRKVGEPVDIVLGNETIAKGEVVQINEEQLGVRITRINC